MIVPPDWDLSDGTGRHRLPYRGNVAILDVYRPDTPAPRHRATPKVWLTRDYITTLDKIEALIERVRG